MCDPLLRQGCIWQWFADDTSMATNARQRRIHGYRYPRTTFSKVRGIHHCELKLRLAEIIDISPEQFFGKRVLVVGIGNTACEVSLSLAKHCSTLYQGYRRGRILVSRYLDNGIPTDSTLSWPVLRLKYLLDYWVPWLTVPIIDNFMIRKMVNDAARHESAEFSQKERTQRAEHKVKHIWRLVPCPSMAHENPAAQEKFIPALYSGDIIPVPGFKEFVGSDAVLLDDGSTVNVDAVIFCTGYSIDFSIMPELEMNGACGLPKDTFDLVDEHMEESKENGEDWSHRRNEPHLPRLYQMIFPPRYASSVAFLSWMAPQENVWCVCELASTAVAQIWAAETAQDLGLQSTLPAKYRNPALLPSVEEMNQAVDGYHDWWRKNWKQNSSMHPGFVRSYTFYRFLHDKAGTGMYENLDHFFSTRGWQLRWEDKELYEWLSNGPMNSYAWRLFDTNPQQIPGCGRKIWPGARQAVQDAVRSLFHLESKRHPQLIFGVV